MSIEQVSIRFFEVKKKINQHFMTAIISNKPQDPAKSRAETVAQSVRALSQHAEGWVFESCQRQGSFLKTDSDSSTDKCSATDVCHGSSEMTIINGCPCHSRCGTLKIPHCSMAMSDEHTLGQNLQPFTGNDDVSI